MNLEKLKASVNLEELLAKQEELSEIYDKAFQDAPAGMDPNQFEEYMAEHGKTEEAAVVSRLIRLVKPVGETSELDEDDDVMTLEEFIQAAKDGNFIDYDGYGRYVDDNGQETDITIMPSDITAGMYRNDFKKIVWYNR